MHGGVRVAGQVAALPRLLSCRKIDAAVQPYCPHRRGMRTSLGCYGRDPIIAGTGKRLLNATPGEPCARTRCRVLEAYPGLVMRDGLGVDPSTISNPPLILKFSLSPVY